VRFRPLGKAGPSISVVGFGAWAAGGGHVWGTKRARREVLEGHNVAAIRAAIASGVNWIDTAEIYGGGLSEEIVGRALLNAGDEILIATKVAPQPEGTGLLADQVKAACRQSLGRLRRDHIDLYQIHWRDEGIPIQETWDAMNELVREGLVRYVGVSNCSWSDIEECLEEHHVDSCQPELSPLAVASRETIAQCHEHGVGVITYAPLCYGLLTGVITRDMASGAIQGDDLSGWLGEMFTIPNIDRVATLVDGLRQLAAPLGASVAQLVVAWNIHQPGVTGTIVGSRHEDHVRENAAAATLELSRRALEDIESLIGEASEDAGR
jgi:aryl-alcohol dehydrogenase-like predicted oxidoreductase